MTTQTGRLAPPTTQHPEESLMKFAMTAVALTLALGAAGCGKEPPATTTGSAADGELAPAAETARTTSE